MQTEIRDKEMVKKEIEIAKKIAGIISKLVIARINLKLTQEELAKKCGLKQSAIARMENLNVFPRIDTIMRVASCLNVDIGVKDVELANVYYTINIDFEKETYSNNYSNEISTKWGEYTLCQ